MDLILIRRCQGGDEEAFAELFQQYKNLVYKTTYLMLGSAEEAEDALQEVMWQVHRSLSTFDPAKGAFTTWLHRVTVNHCLSRRRRWRLSTISLERHVPQVSEQPAFPERLEDEELIRQAVGRLSVKLRAVVVLRYYWDLSYAEIAQVLHIPLGTVKSRLDLAIHTLYKEWGPASSSAVLEMEVAK